MSFKFLPKPKNNERRTPPDEGGGQFHHSNENSPVSSTDDEEHKGSSQSGSESTEELPSGNLTMTLEMRGPGRHWQRIPEHYSAIDTGYMGDCVSAVAVTRNGGMFGYHGLGGFEAITWGELPGLVEDLKTTKVIIVAHRDSNPAKNLKNKCLSQLYDEELKIPHAQFEIYHAFRAVVNREGVVTDNRGRPVDPESKFSLNRAPP
jgi:hypothetical protein